MIIYSIVYCITNPRVILHCYHPGVWCLHNPRVPPDVSGNCHLLPFYCHRPVVGGNSGLLCWFSILLETCKFWLMNIFLALVVGPSAYSGIYIGVWSYSALLTGHFSHFDQQHVFIMIFGLILTSVASFDLKIMIFLSWSNRLLHTAVSQVNSHTFTLQKIKSPPYHDLLLVFTLLRCLTLPQALP